MVVDIDVKQLGNLVIELNKIIDDYEEVYLNIFNQLKDSCINWHDKNSIAFENQLKDEKTFSVNYLNTIKNCKSIFQYIYDEYVSIGKRIYFNMGKKDTIISIIDECIRKLDDVINDFNGVVKSFSYNGLSAINAQKDKLASCKKELQTMKLEITDLYKKINLIEDKVASKIARLEEVEMKAFDYEFNKG